MFGSRDPLGRKIEYDGPVEIVGVVRDVRYAALEQDPHPAVYFVTEQFPRPVESLVARLAPNAGDLHAAVRRIVHDVDPALPILCPVANAPRSQINFAPPPIDIG
jgi:hypothetical protein